MSEVQDPRPEKLKASDWESKRESILRRDGRCCQFCGIGQRAHEERYDSGLNVHHIIPRSAFGTDSSENLISCCSRCHTTAEQISQRFIETEAKRQSQRINSRSLNQELAKIHNTVDRIHEEIDSECDKLKNIKSSARELIEGDFGE